MTLHLLLLHEPLSSPAYDLDSCQAFDCSYAAEKKTLGEYLLRQRSPENEAFDEGIDSLNITWSVLMGVLHDRSLERVYLITDGQDECNDEGVNLLLGKTHKTGQELEGNLRTRSQHTFLWVAIVCQMLQRLEQKMFRTRSSK